MEHEDKVSLSDLPRRGPRRPWLVALVALGLVGLVGAGVQARLGARAAVAQAARPASGPRRVMVSKLTKGAGAQELMLPGTVQPAERAMVNGMVSGVVREVRVNLGDRVKKGQVLAVIDAPEASAQLGVAQARLRASEQSVGLVRQRATRVEELSKTSVTSQQEADAARLDVTAAQAAIDLNKAETRRYAALAGYQRAVAPFDGTVTRRLADPGTVVAPGATPLVELATTQRLEIALDAPQTAAHGIRVGDRLRVQARGKREPVEAVVLRTAGALDAVARTLRVELGVSEEAGLLAGAYVTVQVKLGSPAPVLLAPASALSSGAAGTQLVVVGEGKQAQRRPVRVVRDLGREIEVEGEVREGDVLVLFPPVDLAQGEVVEPVEAPRPKPAGSAGPAASASAR